jgi:putative OmpL-like beta-barrel porin-2
MACARLSTPVQPRETAAVTWPWLTRLGALATVLLFVAPPRALAADTAAGADDFGFLTRLYNAYADEWGMASAPAEPNAPASRRPAPFPPQPENSPPYPFTEWPIGGLNPIGASLPNAVDSPLMKAIGPSPLGKTLEDSHIQIYGWVNGGGNLSTATTGYGGNAPAAYMYTPNLIQLDQAVVYIERVPDEVQQDYIDWGFRVSGIYGENYRFSVGYGPFSDQLVYHNHFAGFDMPMIYGDLYFPGIADGVTLRFGRFISVPDIEAQLAVNSYMYSHSMLYAYDNYTNTGAISSLKLTKNWMLQLGLTMGTDTAVWNARTVSLINPLTGLPGYTGLKDPGARPSVTGCAQWQSDSADDAVYLCANSINNGTWGYNNLQWYGGTFYHKFNDDWHFSAESYYAFQRNVPDVSQGYADTPFSQFLPTNRPGEAYCPSGLTHCTAHVWGVVAFLNYKFTPLDNLTLRGELYDDVDGQRTGFATRYNNWALGWQHWFSPQLEIRPEIAFYHALDKPAFDNGTKHAITIISGDVIWHF